MPPTDTSASAVDLFTFAKKAHYWNRMYERPDNLFEHLMVRRRDYAAAQIAAGFPRSTRILDLGCGAGVLTEKLLELGYRVTAIDASADMLALARQRLKRFPPDAYRLVRGNCLQLPCRVGEYDLVVSLGMFGYFAEVPLALAEIRRTLAPGGCLLMSVRNANTKYATDPAEFAKLPLRKARARLSARPSEAPFTIEIYEDPIRLIRGVEREGWSLKCFDGIGYGPLRIAGRKLLPERTSIALSEALERSLRALRLQRVARWVADVSFFTFQRR